MLCTETEKQCDILSVKGVESTVFCRWPCHSIFYIVSCKVDILAYLRLAMLLGSSAAFFVLLPIVLQLKNTFWRVKQNMTIRDYFSDYIADPLYRLGVHISLITARNQY